MLKLAFQYIALSDTKNVTLVHIFDYQNQKQLVSTVIMCENELITSTHIQTMQFIEEMSMFESGNDQNRYFSVEQQKTIKNLKLKDTNIYFSKSEARVIYKAYNQSLSGYSFVRLFAHEDMLADVRTMLRVFINRWSNCANMSNPQY